MTLLAIVALLVAVVGIVWLIVRIAYRLGYHEGWCDASEDDVDLIHLTSGVSWPD